MTTVAITGSSGFIGTNLCERLGQDYRLLTMDKDGAPGHKLNLVDEMWPRETANVLVHLAGKSNVYCPPGEEEALIAHNLMLAKKALYWCEEKGVDLMINASSSSVYGNRLAPPQQETDFCQPMSAYGTSKLVVEEWLTEQAAKRDVKVLSMRFFNVIGRYQKQTMLPWLIMEAARKGETLPIFGNCERSWTPVEDVCAVIHEAVVHSYAFPQGHTIVNVGRNSPLNQENLVGHFRVAYHELYDASLVVETRKAEPRPFDMKVTQPDQRLYNQFFAHRFTYRELDKAVKDVIAYHREKTR